MKQISLFKETMNGALLLETQIVREGDKLIIPEGLNTVSFTHGLHRFPGKFIPNLPRYLIKHTLNNDKTIFDPFCGSGTTLVEAALNGREFVGKDIDPLAILISKAKTEPLTINDLYNLEQYWQDHDYDDSHEELIPKINNFYHWFTEETARQLSSIKSGCISAPERLKRFSLVVFSSIIRRVSNADDQTQKTYVSHTLPKNPPLPSKLFPVFLKRAIKGMEDYVNTIPCSPKGLIIQADTRNQNPHHRIQDVITSPPYIDSIDYVYNQMLEYFWLLPELGIHTHNEMKNFRKDSMGLKAYEDSEDKSAIVKEYLPESKKIFEKICSEVGMKSKKEKTIIISFFYDFIKHLKATKKHQTVGSSYICVIGNSMIRGKIIPTTDFLEEIFLSAGYKKSDKFSYQIRRHYMKFPRRSNSGKIKQDFVLHFKA